MAYWLFKSEPHAYSFEHLRNDATTPWSGVRNWQARNAMKAMAIGDLGLFYHSSIPRLAGMLLLRRGRLSVQPVTPREWAIVLELAQQPE